jgi:hypothetical protein
VVKLDDASQNLRTAKIYITQARVFRNRKYRKDNEWISFLQNCAAKHRREWFDSIRIKPAKQEAGQLVLF